MSEAGSELEKTLLLLNSSTGLATAGCIEQALRSPHLFSFKKILEHPNVLKLKGTRQEVWIAALELFAYGTLGEYDASKHPKLDAKQLKKLKQLSIVTLASHTSSKVLRYADLMRDLSIATVRELEDLIISSFYAGLIRGRLNQKDEQLEFDFVKGRDISTAHIAEMKKKLEAWLLTSQRTIKSIDDRIAQAQELTTKRDILYAEVQLQIEETTKQLFDKSDKTGGHAAAIGSAR